MADTKDRNDTRKARDKPAVSVAAPSSSIVVVSPWNEVLLLQRVKRGAFPAAHVFPGGNVSSFHEEGLIPGADSATRHVDGAAYQLAAIRETFEESGVLLARDVRGKTDGLLSVPESVARAGRGRVERKEVRFRDWLASVGGEADQQGLIPFTRWVTPPNMARRFTTQMYLYLMPLSEAALSRTAVVVATADQTEVATAEFATAASWVERARRNEIVLFPPQMYILGLLAPLLAGWQQGAGAYASWTSGAAAAAAAGATAAARTHLAAERERLMDMVREGSGSTPGGTPWADLVISPRMMAQLPDGRVVMRLDQPGPELRGSGRTGDTERVVLVGNMPPGPPQDVELCLRSEVMPAIRTQATGTKL